MKLIALKEFKYAGRLVRPGDEFTATDRDAKVLLLVGRVDKAPDEPKPVRRAYKRRDLQAE